MQSPRTSRRWSWARSTPMDEALPESDRLEGVPAPRETSVLFGQDKAASRFFEAAHADRLHHGWLITGPKGVGKATLAWRIARYLLRSERDGPLNESDPLAMDPDAESFRKLASLGDPRLILIRRPYDTEKKRLKTQITVEEVRKLNGFFHLSATDGSWRVAIVDSADEMNISAANALLKILEEPPKKTLIILISHQPGKLLPTIRSRCRTLACEKLGPTDLAQALSHAGFEEMDRVASISELADGSVGEAMSLTQGGGQELYQRIISVLGSLPSLDRTEALAIADGCAGKGKEATYALTRHLLAVALNRMAKAGATGEPLNEAAPGEAEIFARLAPSPQMARIWADLSQELSARIAHGVAVNLDPSGLILDTFLKVEATSARIR